MSDPQFSFDLEGAQSASAARHNPDKVITACGIQADYVLQQMKKEIARAYPNMNSISEPMRLEQPTNKWQPGQSHSGLSEPTHSLWPCGHMPSEHACTCCSVLN